MPQLVKLVTVVTLTGLIAGASALESVVSDVGAPAVPATSHESPADYFTLLPPPQPAGWELLLAALLAGGVIARRRLSRD